VQAKTGTSFKRKPAQIKQEPVPVPAQPVASATVDAKRKEEEEEEEVSDSQADEEESRPAGPVDDDDYMHELFGSYVEDDDEEEQLKEYVPLTLTLHSFMFDSKPDRNHLFPALLNMAKSIQIYVTPQILQCPRRNYMSQAHSIRYLPRRHSIANLYKALLSFHRLSLVGY